MGKVKKKLFVSIILIMLVTSGCGTPQSGNTYIAPQQINEPTVAEITPVFEIQTERVNNCDGTNPTYNVSYKTIEAQKASFEVSVGAGGLVTGTPIPPVLEVQLEAKITAALAKDYGLTTEKNHDLTLNNEQGTFLEHTITWKVTRVKGLIEVVYGDGIAQVGFEKIANVELYDRTSKSLGGCNGSPTTSVSTLIATLETAPPPTTSPQTSQTTFPNITVSANSNSGVQFTAPTSGNYQFTIQDGIYCTSSTLCRSIIRGYLGRDIVWGNSYGLPHPMEQDYEIGCWEQQTASDKNCAVGLSVVINMNEKQYIRWVIMEDKNSFADNKGSITLAIVKLP